MVLEIIIRPWNWTQILRTYKSSPKKVQTIGGTVPRRLRLWHMGIFYLRPTSRRRMECQCSTFREEIACNNFDLIAAQSGVGWHGVREQGRERGVNTHTSERRTSEWCTWHMTGRVLGPFHLVYLWLNCQQQPLLKLRPVGMILYWTPNILRWRNPLPPLCPRPSTPCYYYGSKTETAQNSMIVRCTPRSALQSIFW